MTMWRKPFIGLLVCAAVTPVWAPAEGVDAGGPGTGSIGLLAVQVGNDFKSSETNLHGCRAVDIAGAKRMTCKTATAVGGLKFSALTYESRGGVRVNKVTASGPKPRSCSDAISEFISTLGPVWTVQPFEQAGPDGQTLNAFIQGDLSLRVVCSKYLGLTLTVEDAWLSLPAGEKMEPPGLPQPAPELPLVQVAALARSGISLSPRGVGEVVWAVVENYGNGARTIKVPKARWPDLAARYAWPEVETALATARRSASRLSSRSAKAFEEYAAFVSAEGWFAGECQRAWAFKR